jgi:hypothetical protein
MFYKLDIQIDIDKAKKYYAELEEKYQHLKWESRLGDSTIHGWSIHILKNFSPPFGFYDKNTEPLGIDKYYNSEIYFGWAEDILTRIPYGYRAIMSVNPQGTVVPKHIDENYPDMMRLHIPIITNKDYVWHTHLGELHMEEGTAYLVDTSFEHSTVNNGSLPRVHLGLNVPRSMCHLLCPKLNRTL